MPVKAAGGITGNFAGAVLPNSARPPGAVKPSVSQANTGQTICVSGWTATVRPNSSVTTGLKVGQLASGYTYQGDTATRDYEQDHLISLDLGGAPSVPANLWPEPYKAPEGGRVKDVVENKLHALVCGGTISGNGSTSHRTQLVDRLSNLRRAGPCCQERGEARSWDSRAATPLATTVPTARRSAVLRWSYTPGHS
jgi:hypothetical protein